MIDRNRIFGGSDLVVSSISSGRVVEPLQFELPFRLVPMHQAKCGHQLAYGEGPGLFLSLLARQGQTRHRDLIVIDQNAKRQIGEAGVRQRRVDGGPLVGFGRSVSATDGDQARSDFAIGAEPTVAHQSAQNLDCMSLGQGCSFVLRLGHADGCLVSLTEQRGVRR